MANASTTGFGLRTVTTVGNTPATSGQSEYKIKSGLGVGIFKNNPVSIQDASGDQGYLQDARFATTDDGGSGGAAYDNTGHAPLIGVFNGCFFVNSTTSKDLIRFRSYRRSDELAVGQRWVGNWVIPVRALYKWSSSQSFFLEYRQNPWSWQFQNQVKSAAQRA